MSQDMNEHTSANTVTASTSEIYQQLKLTSRQLQIMAVCPLLLTLLSLENALFVH